MTAQNIGYIKTTLFGTSQSTGAITPLRCEDIGDSFLPWDTTVAGGTGTPNPYVYRGTVDGVAWVIANGGFAGSGQTTGNRTATTTALNSLFSTATTNKWKVEMGAVIWETNGVVTIPYGSSAYSLTFRGSATATVLSSFAVNAAILQIGDISNINNICTSPDIDGINLVYGAAQTTSAGTALFIGAAQEGSICNISVNQDLVGNLPYDAVNIGGAVTGSSTVANFSMLYRRFSCWGWQRYGLNFSAAGGSTGNHFDNWYMPASGAITSGNTQAVVTSYVKFNAGVQDMQFSRTNFEWGNCNIVCDMSNNNVMGLTFEALHCEGLYLSGTTPTVFNSTGGCSLQINTLDWVNPWLLTANTPSLITDWSTSCSSYIITNMMSNPQTASKWATPFIMFAALSGVTLGDDVPVVQIVNYKLLNPGANVAPIQFDVHTPAASFPTAINGFARYVYGPGGSKIEKPIIAVAATATHYSQYVDATYLVKPSITAFTLTLGHTQGATGNQLPTLGNTVHVRRQSGTVSGTLTIADSTGGTITTNATSATDLWFVYGGVTGGTLGSTWIAFTPVT